MMRWKNLLLIAVASVVYVDSGVAQQTIMVKPTSTTDKRLSAELSLVKQTNGVFMGLAPDNTAAVNIDDSELPRAMTSAGPAGITKGGDYEARNLLVTYKAGSNLAAGTLRAAGLALVKPYKAGSFVIVKPEGGVTAAEIDALLNDPAVAHVEPDYILSVPPDEFGGEVFSAEVATTATPNDTLYSDLWGMPNIHADNVWNTLQDAPNVIVAVIDSGVDYKHPDLAANMWKSASGKVGFDAFEDDDDPMDENGHGTHCAGTIAGVGNNGLGVVGVAWKTRVMALRFLGPTGSGNSSDAIKCIDWAVENGAHILSNSWGGGGFSQNLKDAIDRAESKGVLFIAAAGNNGTSDNDVTPHYPSSYASKNIIAVGAIDVADARASFSSFGKNSVDIGAPGVDITSTIPDEKYASFNGTSMATPHVAGAAVLTWAKTFTSPKQDVTQMKTVRDLILTNARKVAALEDRWGHAVVKGGVLDIQFLVGPPPPPSAGCCPIVAAGQFNYGDVKTKGKQTIVSVTIKLAVESDVHMTANTSVQTEKPGSLTIGFSDQSADHMWLTSIRWVESTADNQWVNCGSTASVKLAAGTHVLRWNVWGDEDSESKFDSGSFLVQAHPRSSTSAAASKVQDVRADGPIPTEDAQGNKGITMPRFGRIHARQR